MPQTERMELTNVLGEITETGQTWKADLITNWAGITSLHPLK